MLLTRVHSYFDKADVHFPMDELMESWGSWQTEIIGKSKTDNLTFMAMYKATVFEGRLIEFHRDKGAIQLGRDNHFTLDHLRSASFTAVPGRITLVVQSGESKTTVRFKTSAERDLAMDELRKLLAVINKH
jgi:hypothetical protein